MKGIVLLAPMSDYAAEIHLSGKKGVARGLKAAKKLIRAGRPDELLSESEWKWSLLADAQRFVSLYSGEGAEEIFTYWDLKKSPRTLRSIRNPILVLLAEKDEYADRAAKEIAVWFEKNIRSSHRVRIVPRATHSFHGTERGVAAAIRAFIRAL